MAMGMVVARVLGTDGSWADPFVFDIDAHLQHNLNSGGSADRLISDSDAAFFPSVDHVILADPFVGIHHAVMRLFVKIHDVFKADVKSFVVTAKTAELLAQLFFRELSDKCRAIWDPYGIAMEQINQILIADLVTLNANTQMMHNVIHVLFTDELVVDLEAATVLESIRQI